MGPVKLTSRLVEATRKEAQHSKQTRFLWDTELRGFGVKATPLGHVSWLVQKWVGGRDGGAKRIVIGHLSPAMGLDKARHEAGIVIGDVHKNGIASIVSRKKQQRLAQREALHALSISEAVERYLKRRSTPGRFWSELRTRLENEVVPALGKDTKVANITKTDIRHLIETKEDKHPVAARTLFEGLRPFFKWCVEKDVIPVSPMQNMKAPPIPESRDRILSDAEIKSLWQATEDFPTYGAFYRLLLLTAQRREEVAGIRQSEIDLAAFTWTIPGARTKNGKQHTVHLSPQAIALIKQLFGSRDELFTISGNYSRGKSKLDTRLQIDPWRIHDLRRTAASGMAKLGFQPHIIERVLNHISGAQGGLVAVYQRYEYLEERKRAIEAWGSYVESLVSGSELSGNVVMLPLKTA